MDGEAISGGDLTIMNERVAAAFAWESTPPWGVTKGHIIDLAPVVDGRPLGDLIAQFSFVVNGWGEWPTYESFEAIEASDERVVVRASGWWNDVRVTATYVLEGENNYIYVTTVLVNEGSSTYEDLVMGYAISLKRGWTFTPGFGTGNNFRPTPKAEVGALDDWVSGYGEDFAIGLYAPYYTHLSTSTSWVDPFTIRDLEPGERAEFEAYLIVEPSGDLCRVVATISNIKGVETGMVEGSVYSASGDPVSNPVVIVYREGKPYCWAVGGEEGEYRLELPPGDYTLRATARGYGLSSPASVSISAGERLELDFQDLQEPGRVEVLAVDKDSGMPVDAKIVVEGGETPIVKYLETRVVYTSPDEVGRATITLPPGVYSLRVEKGWGFTYEPLVIENVTVEPGGSVAVEAVLERAVEPNDYNWYSADLHHHGDHLEARTSPGYLVVAQSAADLDFAFVSDHDYTGSYAAIAGYAESRGMPFIPSVEVSPAWAHFNPYPLPLTLAYEPIRGDACSMMEEMRRLGAIVIRINHPATGYFSSWEKGEIPGGYCDDWDVAEINGRWGSSDEYTLEVMWSLWDQGVRKYLTAGSDVHDVWATPYTGVPRVYAYIEGEPTPEAFAQAEKSGKSYITYGPLILEMNPLPGDAAPSTGTLEVELELFSLDGIAAVRAIAEGRTVYEARYDNAPRTLEERLALDLTSLLEDGYTWVQIIVEEPDEDLAIANPIWVYKSQPITQTTTETTTLTQTQTITETKTETATETQTTTKTETTTQTTATTTTTLLAAIAGLIIGAAAATLLLKQRR